jgi:hypothetical protein
MGPVNWLAVFLAAAVASLVLRLFWRGPESLKASWFYLLPLVPAAMLGHALARIGAEKLAAKPQLYVMQSGGLALAIVLPALWMVHLRAGLPARDGWRDSAAFVLAFLAMGWVFYALG